MRISKRLIWLVVLVLMVTTSHVMAEDNGGRSGFEDVPDGHWAKDYIQLMNDYGIINGYDDNLFKPEATVTRAEFAKMMVLTLNLELFRPATATFVDVPRTNWAFPYVETGKLYLTGFRSTSGDYFRPSNLAVREDMAVAIVKGLNIDPDATDLSVLEGYTDATSISPNLRKYVAAAINEGVMVGDGGKFNAQGNLTRAEAATLLARLIVDEKVTYDADEKVTYDTAALQAQKTPVLEKVDRENDVVLEWTSVPEEGFKYYKVVVSKGNSSPSYPNDGYAAAISDVTNTRFVLSSGGSYHGGDVGGLLKGGQSYYVSITAVYESGNKTSNVLEVSLPGTYQEPSSSDRTPVLTYQIKDNGVYLTWTQTPSSSFQYYKVVLSKTVASPYYPDYGYLTYITDPSKTSYLVKEGQHYNDGSKGGIGSEVDDVAYYMTITAVYKDGKYTSNSIRVTVPDL